MKAGVKGWLQSGLGFFAGILPAAEALAASKAREDIRDIRAPLAFPAWWHWPLLILAAALAVAGVVALVRWWRNRATRALTPIERARQALLAAEKHAREGRSRAWADVVAETLRAALTARLGAGVLPQTTSELSQAPWAQVAADGQAEPPPSSGEPRLLEAPRALELLHSCDLARFAMASLDTDALLAQTTLARDLVERLFAPPPAAAHPATAVLAAELVKP